MTMMRLFLLVLVGVLFSCPSSTALRYPPRARESGKLVSSPIREHRRRLKDSKGYEYPDDDDDDDYYYYRTPSPTPLPTPSPTTLEPTQSPMEEIDEDHADEATETPTDFPTASPSMAPTPHPSNPPTPSPSMATSPPTDRLSISPTSTPSTGPTTSAPSSFPTTGAPSSEPSPVPTPAPSAKPSPVPTLSFAPSYSPTVTASPSAEPTTPAPVVLLTTRVDLEDFEISIVWDQGFASEDQLEILLETEMRTYFTGNIPSFTDVDLEVEDIEIDEETTRRGRRLQTTTTNRAVIDFSGFCSFDGTETVTQDEIWAVQSNFLQSFSLPSDGNVQVESITLDSGETFTPAAASGSDTGDREVETEPESTTTTTSSSSIYGPVVGALVGGISFAVLGAVYYLRRSKQGYHAHNGVPLAELQEMDPEDNTTLPGKATMEVDTTGRGGYAGKGDSTTPTTLGSENSDPDCLSPSSTEGNGRPISPTSPADEQVSSHSLLSGVLPSLAEENSHEVVAETDTSGDEYIAEVGDDNLDVSVLVDADDEFAAVPAGKEPPGTGNNNMTVVDAATYSNWVTPLLRHIDSTARDCCTKGAGHNVMDTTLPHDLLVSDIELAEQNQRQTLASDRPMFDAYFDEADVTNEGESEQNDSTVTPKPDDEEVSEDSSNAMRRYAAKYHPHPAMIHRTSNAAVAASEDSSVNLSQQASFMTDDMDVGADLLDKALRDVTLLHPDEDDNHNVQVQEYMYQVRREAIEHQQTSRDEDSKEVTL